jgi:hypothetical protein
MKVKDLIERLEKLDPNDRVFSILLTREFVPISGDEPLRESDWDKILSLFMRGFDEDGLSDAFSNSYNDILLDYFCDSCCEYDYETKDIGDEGNYCKNCGEEQDEVS